jgi:alpha-galactosidase
MTRSGEGLGGMSRAIHRLFLDRLLPRNWSDTDPPILLNSWEAKYFHVNHHNIVEMAQQVRCNLIIFILHISSNFMSISFLFYVLSGRRVRLVST